MSSNTVAFVDELIELIKYKIELVKNADDQDVKSYFIGQIDGLMLVAMRLADADQVFQLARIDSSFAQELDTNGVG